jgi:hypothetical protein
LLNEIRVGAECLASMMRDLVLLGHFVEDNWEGLRGLGIEKEVG